VGTRANANNLLAETSAAAVAIQPFVLYALALWIFAPSSEAHWANVDPILKIVPCTVMLAFVVVVGFASPVVMTRIARPEKRAFAWAAIGVVFGMGLALVLRAIVGSTLPAFIPSEESAKPGPTLNMMAGVAEEVLFRLALLTATYVFLAKRTTRVTAVLVSALISGVAFALLHHVGPGASSVAWFMTRTLIPGFAFNVVYLVRPSFLVCAHCAAHIAIPLVFV